MSLTLHDLMACCRQLESDKATERKREIEKFKRLICDSETIQHLDQNSDSKSNKQMNWDTVFRFLQKYIQKETESARLAKPNVSASTQATREKKMQEISSLVKYFIRCANKRKPRLQCQELLIYVMNTVNDSSIYIAYGADCNSILLKNILTVRKYWCEISGQQWSDLQNTYFKLFLKPSRNINRVLVARIISTLTRGLCFQTDGSNPNIFDFFSRAMQFARQERNPSGLGHIFEAINIYLSVFAVNYRRRVCKLGEDILPTVLYTWAQYKPNNFLKEQILQLVQLQVRIHHPNGAKTQEKGMCSSAKWQSILYNLYDLLVNEINLIGSRGKYSAGARNIAVKENLIELMADICHQVFTEDTRVLEISQFVAQRDCGDGEGPSKRRKIELGWEVIRENLQKSQKDFHLIPWLQITTRLLSKYPKSLPCHEFPHLLNILYQLLPQHRRGERMPYVLRCLKEIALCQSQKTDLEATQKLELQKTWAKIWSLVVRSVSLQHTEVDSFGLLGVMIRRNLLTLDREIWKIFSEFAYKPSSSAVQCLALAVTTLEVPETLKTGPLQSNCEGSTACSLKETIIKWLLFYHGEEDMEHSAELPPILCSYFPNLELQKTLVSLTMKNSRAAMEFFRDAFECVHRTEEKDDASLPDIEAFYMQTTFDEIDTNIADDISEKELSASRLVVNQKLRESLEHDLLVLSELLFSSFSPETPSPEILVRCASLLVGVLGCYCYAGTLTEEDASKSELFHKAKSLTQHVGENISQSKSKLNEDFRINSLRTLIVQCTRCLCNCTQRSLQKILSGIFLQLFPSKLMNDLADICNHLINFTGKTNETGEGDIMQDDLEESRIEGEAQQVLDLMDDHCSEAGDVNEVGELQTMTGAKSPLTEDHLTKQDLLLLDILKFLCIAATAVQDQTVHFRASEIWRKLLILIDGNRFDYIKPLHLQMYLLLLKELPSEENPLLEDHVVSLLKPLPDICSFYRRDQEVCATILHNLLPMITALGSARTDTEDLSEAKGQVLTVVGAFWHLSNEGKCTAPVRVALVNCMKALLQADPYSKWTVLNVKCENLPVSDAFPQFLADSSFQVCMVAARSITSLFQDVKLKDSTGLLKALPLKLQQSAFENLYLKFREGTKKLVHGTGNRENLPDEEQNRKSVLLMLITMILRCSPLCEKQALFAVFQCVREDGLEPYFVRKVLERISGTLGYKNADDFIQTHLDYLVLEWLNCNYSLSVFPFVLLNYSTLDEFFRFSYKVLIPQLVVKNQFEEVKSIADKIERGVQPLLAHCFPKILANILPYFAIENHEDSDIAQKRDSAYSVYETLKKENFLGKELIDNLFHGNLPEIVVEVLLTLHEPIHIKEGEDPNLVRFTGDLDPTPNPLHFPSYVIKATLDYISRFHKNKPKGLVAVLSKNPESFQKILLSICKQASGTSNIYKRHRILMIYHFFVNLLLKEIKNGLGGAWAFVLRDVIYTVIHHISNRLAPLRGISLRSFLLCCDLLSSVCHTAVQYCEDALGSHLHVIVGALIPIVGEQPETQEEVLALLRYLVIENKDNKHMYQAIKHLDPFPDHPAFKELCATQQQIKYSRGEFSLLEEINHFLSVNISDSLPLTRLEGLNDLRKKLEDHKEQMKNLMKEFQENPKDCVIMKLMACFLQLSKTAVTSTNAVLGAVGNCLGEIGPISFSSTALQHNISASYLSAADFFGDQEFQRVFIMLTLINNVLIDQCIEVRSAAATCLRNILMTKTGHAFWDAYQNKGDPMLVYLYPFRVSKKKFLEVTEKTGETPSEDLDNTLLWIPQRESHDVWIKTLTCALLGSGWIKSEVLLLLKPLCEVQTAFCQTVLPYLIHDILSDSNESERSVLSTHIQMFFTTCCKYVLSSSRSSTPVNSDSDSETFSHGSLDKLSRRTMLSVVDYLRRQKRNPSSTAFDDSFWLELNYLQVALAAQSCAAHFTALLYTEIYADKINLSKEQERSASKVAKRLTFEESSQTSSLASLSEKSKEEIGISLQDLLLDIYRSIGEPDSLYGCGGGRMLQPLTRIRTYEHEAVWGKALVTYDLETSLPPSTRQAGITKALQNFGLWNILSIYLRGLEQENTEYSKELEEIRYQEAWRNMQWDQMSSVTDELEGKGYHQSLYDALQCLRDNEFSTFYERLKCVRVKEVEELSKGSLESVYSLLPTLCRLQTIEELEGIGQLFSGSITRSQLNDMHLKWQKQSQLLQDSDFCFQEPIMALRTVILKILLEKENGNAERECIKDILTRHLMSLSHLARVAKNTQLAERAIFEIKPFAPLRHGVSEWKLEEAQVFWAKQERSLALTSLKEMIKTLDQDWLEVEQDPCLRLVYAECLRLCGSWLAETCLENPTVIMQNYLEKAVEIAGNPNGDRSDDLKSGKMKAFLSLARFSDTQYQRIENYMKSSEFENKQALLKKAKEEVGIMKEHKIQNSRYIVKIQRELVLDERAICALCEDRKRFLCKAVENYIRCLLSGEEHDMWIFRLCSLWLENPGVSEVSAMMQTEAQKIPSYKFLPLMYQLAARMGTKMIGFHQILNNLIARISLDHPHHTLFIILALANANKDELLTKQEGGRSSRLMKNTPKETSPLDMDRMEAASKIINIIKGQRTEMVAKVEALCDAYIMLANMDANHWKLQRGGITIPSDQPITKLKNLEDVVVPTMEIKVDPSGNYENLITIRSFKPEFRLAGGVNLPKIIDCVGSDGRERRQLVKGRDDLRQDAVMQQVFQMCNSLLQQNTETRKRKLAIRRYKVVPLSQRSGVLEWCAGTIPLGEFLINTDSSAHKRYRPTDYSNMVCQRKMMDAQRKDFQEKHAIFMDICQNFQPVFRYFCMEKFLDPAVWFEKRLAYTRSVATSSIVGYILGLGDRHVQNILVDEQTAELVHIDLGVAFEQGKILPTPETVPFRLTRDIVDGMGITGVEGVFRRCCEKTMFVMRNSQEALLTIVEVLLYDPLFDWTMNPLKALYLQQRPEDDTDVSSSLNSTDQECNKKINGDNQTFNKVAERVLMRLQEKLKGVEEGTVLSVGGQVNLLIQQAMDPKNLSRLFPGWKAWV